MCSNSLVLNLRKLVRLGFWSALVFSALSLPAYAQLSGAGIDEDRTSGMRSGNNTIVGQVILPVGATESRHLTVRLSSVRVGEFSTMTDDNGVFTFRRLREGSYFISVEAGKDFLPAQETVDLYDNTARTTTVQIQLRFRPAVNAKPAVVDASLAGIPKPAVEHYQKGIAASAAGDNKKAVEELNAALAIYPHFVLALNELSAIYVNINNLEKAEQTLMAAVGVEPNNATLHLNYGYVLLLRGRFEESDRELHRAIDLKPDLMTAHLYRGRVLIRLGKLDDAESELRRAIALGGAAAAVAYRYLGALYSERGETAKAIEALEKYLKLLPSAKDANQVQAIIKQLRDEAAAKK